MIICELETYGENPQSNRLFSVSGKWLLSKIDVSLEEFYNSYTFDDSEHLYRSAKEDGQLLTEGFKDSFSMKVLLIKLNEIKADIENQLLTTDKDFIDYPIIEDELDDVNCAIEACTRDNVMEILKILHEVLRHTTSNTLHEVLNEFLEDFY